MKQMLTIRSGLLVVGLATLLLGFDHNRTIRTDVEISELIRHVSSSNILNTATTMQNFRTRQACSDTPEPGHGVTPARDFLFQPVQRNSWAAGQARPLLAFGLSELANFQRNRMAARTRAQSPGGRRRTLRFSYDESLGCRIRRPGRQRLGRTDRCGS